MSFEVLKENLKKRGFAVSVFETAQDATQYLSNELENMSIAFGGSRTIEQMCLYDALKSNNEVWWHGDKEQVEKHGRDTVRKNAMTTSVYITSANGVSEEGSIINIDGVGNRISSTAFGHKKIYYVIGKNKIAKTFSDALWRARNIAGPMNAKRLGMNTPCAEKGDKCYDCNSLQRICRGFLVTERPMMGQMAEVVIINEDLGF